MHQVVVGIEVVIAASAHLFLHGLQVVKGGSFRIELGIHWKSLHKHADRVRKSHVFSSVIDGVEDRFLLAGGLGEQQGVCGCQEVASEHAVGLAELLYLLHADTEGFLQTALNGFS